MRGEALRMMLNASTWLLKPVPDLFQLIYRDQQHPVARYNVMVNSDLGVIAG